MEITKQEYVSLLETAARVEALHDFMEAREYVTTSEVIAILGFTDIRRESENVLQNG